MLLLFFISVLNIAERETCAAPTAVDQQNFSVWRGSDKVGKLTAWQCVDGARTAYFLTSDVSFDFLVSVTVKERITDVFESGNLKTSSHERFINGDLKISNSLSKDDKGYVVTSHGGHVSYLKAPITSSILSLYFHEPNFNQQVFSQSHRRMVSVNKTKDHTYVAELPNGATTTFRYREHRLVSVESSTRFGVIRFISEGESL